MNSELTSRASVPTTNPIVESFKAFYRELNMAKLDDISTLYADDIVFRDPVHQLKGIHALHSYMNDLCSNLRQCQFEYLDQLIGPYSAYIKWHMHFSHVRLGNRTITVRGMTHIQFDQKVYFHEDSYDLGQMLYEQLPLLGPATRFLKKRLANNGGD